MIKGYIYKHQFNDRIYIGQTTNKNPERRWGNDPVTAYKSNKPFVNLIKKYGWENFTHEIIKEVEAEDKESLIRLLNHEEEQYIKKYNSLFPNGLNLRSGGENRIPSEYTRRKQSIGIKKSWESGKRKPQDQSFRETASYKKYREELRKRMKENNPNRSSEIEVRLKQSIAHRGRKYNYPKNKKPRDYSLEKERAEKIRETIKNKWAGWSGHCRYHLKKGVYSEKCDWCNGKPYPGKRKYVYFEEKLKNLQKNS